MVKLHQFSDNLYGTDFTELKDYLAACNAYEEPSQAKLQVVPRLAWCDKVFVLIETAMYRTLLATCGSAEMLAH